MNVSCLPPQAFTPLRPFMACIMLAERANLVTIPLVHDDVTVGAKVFILCNPWSADRQKPHGVSFVMHHRHVQMHG
jgi:hypothetical protein